MSGESCLPRHHALPSPQTKTCSYRGAGGLGNKYVRLNVGGALFYTTLQVLTRQSSMLRAMFSGKKEVLTDQEEVVSDHFDCEPHGILPIAALDFIKARQGWILIDRSGKHFGSILAYLRDSTVTLPEGRQAVQELLAEANHYLIQGLVELCHSSLQEKNEQPLCGVPVITSTKEEDKLIQGSTKPVVKLVYNRSNNKYSYTSNSDDNLLKNIELFDRLSLSFNGRVLFIKDVIGDEICCWSFYGQSRKLAEVCCTSIVYATEKKQTKVEFPEARIYEETLNTMLYETMPPPDNSLLEATRRTVSSCGCHSEEEEGPGGAGAELRERVRRIHVKRYSTYDDRPLGH